MAKVLPCPPLIIGEPLHSAMNHSTTFQPRPCRVYWSF